MSISTSDPAREFTFTNYDGSVITYTETIKGDLEECANEPDSCAYIAPSYQFHTSADDNAYWASLPKGTETWVVPPNYDPNYFLTVEQLAQYSNILFIPKKSYYSIVKKDPTQGWGSNNFNSIVFRGYSTEAIVLANFETVHGAVDGTSVFPDGSAYTQPNHITALLFDQDEDNIHYKQTYDDYTINYQLRQQTLNSATVQEANAAASLASQKAAEATAEAAASQSASDAATAALALSSSALAQLVAAANSAADAATAAVNAIVAPAPPTYDTSGPLNDLQPAEIQDQLDLAQATQIAIDSFDESNDNDPQGVQAYGNGPYFYQWIAEYRDNNIMAIPMPGITSLWQYVASKENLPWPPPDLVALTLADIKASRQPKAAPKAAPKAKAAPKQQPAPTIKSAASKLKTVIESPQVTEMEPFILPTGQASQTTQQPYSYVLSASGFVSVLLLMSLLKM